MGEAVPEVIKGGYSGDATLEDQTNSTIAEMRLHPSGKYLYVGNRGHNSIAIFKVSPLDGSLSLVDIQDSFGAFPRHFNFDNTSQFLLVGNHASNTIVAFRILETGKLDMVENIPSIVWVTPVTHQD